MNSNPGGDLSSLRNFGSNAANIDDIISLDITDLGNNGTQSLDMSLLANQNKVPSSPKTPQPQVTASPHVSTGSTFQISNPPPAAPSIAEGIEFVNIEDTQKTYTASRAATDALSFLEWESVLRLVGVNLGDHFSAHLMHRVSLLYAKRSCASRSELRVAL